jgi:hypothetical protein
MVKSSVSLGVVAHVYNSSIWEAEAGDFEFEASVGYIVSSRSALAIQKKKRESSISSI